MEHGANGANGSHGTNGVAAAAGPRVGIALAVYRPPIAAFREQLA